MTDKSEFESTKQNTNQAHELTVKDLHISVEGEEIVKGVSLSVKSNEIVAIMGPNGSGKSTLVNTIMGHPKYEVTKGIIMLDSKDITNAGPEERARAGLFLSFQ